MSLFYPSHHKALRGNAALFLSQWRCEPPHFSPTVFFVCPLNSTHFCHWVTIRSHLLPVSIQISVHSSLILLPSNIKTSVNKVKILGVIVISVDSVARLGFSWQRRLRGRHFSWASCWVSLQRRERVDITRSRPYNKSSSQHMSSPHTFPHLILLLGLLACYLLSPFPGLLNRAMEGTLTGTIFTLIYGKLPGFLEMLLQSSPVHLALKVEHLSLEFGSRRKGMVWLASVWV